jgi:hypothetical protein
MPATMTLIASVTVPAGLPTSIDFTSIPATYTDLKFLCSLREGFASSNNINVNVKVNNLGTTIYSRIYLYGNNGGAPSGASNTGTAETVMFLGYADGNTSTSNVFASAEYYIAGYATANFKPVSADAASEGNSSDQTISTVAAQASTTAAINQVSFFGTGTGWIQGSTIYLYGIKNS